MPKIIAEQHGKTEKMHEIDHEIPKSSTVRNTAQSESVKLHIFDLLDIAS